MITDEVTTTMSEVNYKTPIGGLARVYQDIQGLRIALGNKTWAAEYGEGRSVPAIYDEMISQLKEMEKNLIKEAGKELKDHPAWLCHGNRVKGFGTTLAAQLYGAIATIERFDTISKMWKYLGLGVDTEGRADRMRKGQKACYNPRFKALMYNIGCSFIKTNSPYRRIYDDKKKYYQQVKQNVLVSMILNQQRKGKKLEQLKDIQPWKTITKHLGEGSLAWTVDDTITTARAMEATSKKSEPWKALLETSIEIAKKKSLPEPWTDNHVHMAALRKMEKIFLSHVYLTWRRHENLPVRDPYPMEYLGHTTMYEPEEFMSEEKPKRKRKAS